MFEGTLVKQLKGSDFEDDKPWNLCNKRCAFILFYADWCGHCQNFKPEYVKFADVAQFINVGAVDSDAEKGLMEKLGKKASPVKVEGFPTLWIYHCGKPVEMYTGERTWQELLEKAKKVCDGKCKCDK